MSRKDQMLRILAQLYPDFSNARRVRKVGRERYAKPLGVTIAHWSNVTNEIVDAWWRAL